MSEEIKHQILKIGDSFEINPSREDPNYSWIYWDKEYDDVLFESTDREEVKAKKEEIEEMCEKESEGTMKKQKDKYNGMKDKYVTELNLEEVYALLVFDNSLNGYEILMVQEGAPVSFLRTNNGEQTVVPQDITYYNSAIMNMNPYIYLVQGLNIQTFYQCQQDIYNCNWAPNQTPEQREENENTESYLSGLQSEMEEEAEEFLRQKGKEPNNLRAYAKQAYKEFIEEVTKNSKELSSIREEVAKTYRMIRSSAMNPNQERENYKIGEIHGFDEIKKAIEDRTKSGVNTVITETSENLAKSEKEEHEKD